MAGNSNSGNRTKARGTPPSRRILLSVPLARRIRAIAPDLGLNEIGETVMDAWVTEQEQQRYEQLLRDIETFLATDGIGSSERAFGTGPSLLAVMGEFDLTEGEARAALYTIGERLRQRREAADA